MLNNGRVLNFSAPQNLDCRLKLIKSLNGLLEEVRAKDMIPLGVGLDWFSSNSKTVFKRCWFGKLARPTTSKKNKTIPDGGVAPRHLLRFRLSHMI